MAEAELFANEEFAVKYVAIQREIDALDKSGKDYDNKLKQLQDREAQLTQQHENTITEITDKAEGDRNRNTMSAEDRLRDSMAQGLTASIMGHETWARMVSSLGDQVVSGIIKNSLLILMQQDKQRLGDAKTAASNTYMCHLRNTYRGAVPSSTIGCRCLCRCHGL